jgi:hypothetical protein
LNKIPLSLPSPKPHLALDRRLAIGKDMHGMFIQMGGINAVRTG